MGILELVYMSNTGPARRASPSCGAGFHLEFKVVRNKKIENFNS